MKHITVPPDANGFHAVDRGSVFVEFDVDEAQIVPGGRRDWFIIFGPNSFHGRSAARKGNPVKEMPSIHNIIITEVK